MNDRFDRVPIRLGKGLLLRLSDPVGTGVRLDAGSLWITQYGDPRDIALAAGESFIFDRPGLAIVQAFDASELSLFEPDPEAWPRMPQDVTVHAGAA